MLIRSAQPGILPSYGNVPEVAPKRDIRTIAVALVIAYLISPARWRLSEQNSVHVEILDSETLHGIGVGAGRFGHGNSPSAFTG